LGSLRDLAGEIRRIVQLTVTSIALVRNPLLLRCTTTVALATCSGAGPAREGGPRAAAFPRSPATPSPHSPPPFFRGGDVPLGTLENEALVLQEGPGHPGEVGLHRPGPQPLAMDGTG